MYISNDPYNDPIGNMKLKSIIHKVKIVTIYYLAPYSTQRSFLQSSSCCLSLSKDGEHIASLDSLFL